MKSGVPSIPAHRSYGNWRGIVQHLAALAVLCLVANAVTAEERPIKLVVLGDSLVAGFQLPASAAFPAQLERALRAKGFGIEVANAGVSGDTATGGLSRLDWSVPDGTDAVILELGANDMLRGTDPAVPRQALSEIVRRLKARHIQILLCGMRAAPNLGPDYARSFDSIYPDIASANGLLLYPFFLDGIVTDPSLNQHDGLHPTEAGVAVIVQRILPTVVELLSRVRANPKS